MTSSFGVVAGELALSRGVQHTVLAELRHSLRILNATLGLERGDHFSPASLCGICRTTSKDPSSSISDLKMPKVKSEKRSEVSAAPYESPVKNGDKEVAHEGAAGEEGAVGAVPTAGFRDAARATQTLDALRERDSAYQYQVVTSLMRRAKTILSKTKDPEKVNNLTEAIKVFDDWVNEYKAHNRSRENFNYLPLDTMEGYEPLAVHYGIRPQKVTENFLQVFQDIKADSRLLRTTKVPKVDSENEESITWDIQRNRHLKEISGSIRKEYIPLFETDQPLRGLPSKEHCLMIMWGYSPEPTKVKKCIPQIAEKLSSAEH